MTIFEKMCHRCEKTKEAHKFGRRSESKDGLQSWCQQCMNENRRFGNPAYLVTVLSSARSRARRMNIPFNLTLDDLPPIPERCPITGHKFRASNGKPGPGTRSCTLDRIIPELGYVPGNVRWISATANSIKGDKSADDLRNLVNARIHMKLIHYIEDSVQYDNTGL